MLAVRSDIPEGFLRAHPTALEDVLSGPTLIHLAGRREPPLFVSVLQHGNETSGILAVQRLLGRYEPGGGTEPLPRSISIFVGNVAAAAHGVRRLRDQPDYNRVWPGAQSHGTPEHRLMAAVVDQMAKRGVFASVDLHNNTGRNPHYACLHRLDHRYLQLATLFGRTVVYAHQPKGVQSMAFSEMAPSVTVECGRPGQPHGSDHAHDFLEACLHLTEIPDRPVPSHDIDIFHTTVTVKVPPGVAFGFDAEASDLVLREDIDLLNFRELEPGERFASVRDGVDVELDVRDDDGREVGERYFARAANEIQLAVPAMPSMLTKDLVIIRQDCLGYLMERYPYDP